MNTAKKHFVFKSINIFLAIAFIALDIAWASPPEPRSNSYTLAAQSPFQQQMMTQQAERFQRSIFASGALLNSVYDIGEYFFGDAERDMESLPSRFAEEVIASELGKALGEANITVESIVPVEYLRKTSPDKLKTALDEIGFKGKLPDEGVVFILYRKADERFLVQVAKKGDVSPKNLPGYEWVISDKYVVKYVPEDYVPSKAKAVEAKVPKVEDAPEVTISEPIAEVEAPETKTEEVSAAPKRTLNIRAIHTTLLSINPFAVGLGVAILGAIVKYPAVAIAVLAGLGILATLVSWFAQHKNAIPQEEVAFERVISAPENLKGITPINIGKIIIEGEDNYRFETPGAFEQLGNNYQEKLRQIIGFASHYIHAPPLEANIIIEPTLTEKPSIWYDKETIHIQTLLFSDIVPLEYAYFVIYHTFISQQSIQKSIEFLEQETEIAKKISAFLNRKDCPVAIVGTTDDMISLMEELLQLADYDRAYFRALHRKFTQKPATLEIGKNFTPSALLKPAEREKLISAKEYTELKRKKEYADAAKNVILRCNPMDGGIGAAVAREEYLRGIWNEIFREGEVKLGAKGTDLYFDVTVKGRNEEGKEIDVTEKISITELKYLQAIVTAKEYGRVIIEELVNDESEKSVRDFLNTPYLLDRVNRGIPENEKRTYRDVIQNTGELEVSENFILQALLPTIDLQTEGKLLTTERTAPGSHGQLGSMALQDALTAELPREGKVLIRTVYNGDGPNNFPDPYIVGYMAEEKLPIIMVTTTKTPIDMKGGQIGIQKKVKLKNSRLWREPRRKSQARNMKNGSTA